MKIIVRNESPRQPEVMRLLSALDAYLASFYPPGSNHILDPLSVFMQKLL